MRATWLSISLIAFGLAACGGDSDTDFGSGTGGKSGSGGATGGKGGKGGTGGGGAGGASGSGGTNPGGTGGGETGGTGGGETGGTGGGETGGTGGGETGGTGGDGGTGGNTGGTGGSTGGTGGSTGGTGGSTGGTGGSTGGTGGSTGGTGGSTGGTGGSTGGTGGTGGGGPTCKELADDYLTTLEAAKKCNPVLSVLQCTKLVDDELACPCETFVNPGNSAELTKLGQLQQQWKAQGCQVGVICPAVLCKVPTGGVCTSSGPGSGSCKDV